MLTVSKAVLAAAMLQVAEAGVTLITPGLPAAGFGTPSGGLSQTLLYHDSLAWVDLPGAKFKQVPEEIQGIPTSVPSAQIIGGSKIKFDCPLQVHVGCQGYIWFYVCPGKNCNPVYQGGLPGLLAATAGWIFTVCAPRFISGVPSHYIHDMRGYRYRLAPGDSEEVVVPSQAEFLAFGFEENPVDCSAYLSKVTCETSTTFKRCLWNAADSKCVETTCRGSGHGPAPPCLECPWQGLVVRPPADGP